MIIQTIEEVTWRNEIEEEINRDRETEKIRESGSHILRKRKLNRKNKYKEEGEKLKRKPVIKEMRTETTQRKLLKAGRREVVNIEKGESEKKKEREDQKHIPQDGDKPHRNKNRNKKEDEVINRKKSGIRKRENKKRENVEVRKKLQETMRKWLKAESITREKNLASKESIVKKNKERESERKIKVVREKKKVQEKREIERKSLGVPERGEKLCKRPDLTQNKDEALEVRGTGKMTSDKENKKKVQVQVRTNLLSETISDKREKESDQ